MENTSINATYFPASGTTMTYPEGNVNGNAVAYHNATVWAQSAESVYMEKIEINPLEHKRSFLVHYDEMSVVMELDDAAAGALLKCMIAHAVCEHGMTTREDLPMTDRELQGLISDVKRTDRVVDILFRQFLYNYRMDTMRYAKKVKKFLNTVLKRDETLQKRNDTLQRKNDTSQKKNPKTGRKKDRNQLKNDGNQLPERDDSTLQNDVNTLRKRDDFMLQNDVKTLRKHDDFMLQNDVNTLRKHDDFMLQNDVKMHVLYACEKSCEKPCEKSCEKPCEKSHEIATGETLRNRQNNSGIAGVEVMSGNHVETCVETHAETHAKMRFEKNIHSVNAKVLAKDNAKVLAKDYAEEISEAPDGACGAASAEQVCGLSTSAEQVCGAVSAAEVCGAASAEQVCGAASAGQIFGVEPDEQVCGVEPEEKGNSVKIDYGRIMDEFNKLFDGILPTVRTMSQRRKKAVRARLREFGADSLRVVLAKVQGSPFLQGQGDRGWKASFDWIMRPANYEKIAEGNYDVLMRRPAESPRYESAAERERRLNEGVKSQIFNKAMGHIMGTEVPVHPAAGGGL